MKSLSKKNSKLLIVFMSLAVSMFGFNSMDKNASALSFQEVTQDESVGQVYFQESGISANMLNIDTAVITDVRVESVSGNDSGITMKFSNLPNISEKIFAVLVDEAAGGVIQSKYLDGSNSVTFDIMPDSIKVPGVHLYKQGANDEPFLLRRENFIASTSYMMPKLRSSLSSASTRYGGPLDGNGAPLYTPLIEERSKGSSFSQSLTDYGLLNILTTPNSFVFDFPLSTLNVIEGASGLEASDILAAVIAEDGNGNTLDVRQWVATQYVVSSGSETKALVDGEFVQERKKCRFEFILPSSAKVVQIHLYKHGLFKENFLCKYLFNVTNGSLQPPDDEGSIVL